MAPNDFPAMLAVVNDAAEAFRGVIAVDCWKEPYFPVSELERELADGVDFYVYEEDDGLKGLMGLQRVDDVWLVRHAYVRTSAQRQGVGTALLGSLAERASRPLLVGTWADARAAIRFYAKAGFRMVSTEEKDRLLRRYWSLPDRQIETSVVLRLE